MLIKQSNNITENINLKLEKNSHRGKNLGSLNAFWSEEIKWIYCYEQTNNNICAQVKCQLNVK